MNTINNELTELDNMIKETNNIVKETYKKVQLVKNSSSDQDIIYNNINKLIGNYSKLIEFSYNVDDVKIWEEVVDSIDNQDIEEIEKKTYSEFFLGTQMVRGKVDGLKQFYQSLKENNIDIDNKKIDNSLNENKNHIIENNSNYKYDLNENTSITNKKFIENIVNIDRFSDITSPFMLKLYT